MKKRCNDMDNFGLMFYNARWYDPSLGCFAQADTIIPGGVQGLDRYAYTNNNPVRYTDPTGHCIACIFAGLGAAKQVVQYGLSAFGLRPDVEGALIASIVTANTDSDILVTAGVAVQSEFPWGIVGGNAEGWTQATFTELMDSQGNPYSPGVATTIMKNRIEGAIQECTRCQNGVEDGVDMLIVAAMAQNGYDLNFKHLPQGPGKTIDWRFFFNSPVGGNTSDPFAQIRQDIIGMDYNAEFMVRKFIQDLRYLMAQGYDLPEGITKEDIKAVEELLETWREVQQK